MYAKQSICSPIMTPLQKDYAAEIGRHLSELGLFVDVDNGTETLQKKIRNAEIAQYNFIFGKLSFLLSESHSYLCHIIVVGQVELDSKSVNVRNRDDIGTKARSQDIPLDTIKRQLCSLKESRSIDNALPSV
jgi:threonyl-tRNA synthetase